MDSTDDQDWSILDKRCLLFLDELRVHDDGLVWIGFREVSSDPTEAPGEGLGMTVVNRPGQLRATIEFTDHVFCSKTEERYDQFPMDGARAFDQRNRFVVFASSPLLDYVASVTYVWEDWLSGPLQHYRLSLDTASIDVVTDQPPILTRLAPDVI